MVLGSSCFMNRTAAILFLVFVYTLTPVRADERGETQTKMKGSPKIAHAALPPGAEPFDTALLASMEKRKEARGEAYRPRTRHLNADGSALYTNRLFLETSPYLLQHAHNPVNWYAWGEEAFASATRLNRPVLLSIGYSTCHWCHVMEEESFEDQEIAKYLNEHYIAIKVDREERVDLDAIYMNAVQAISGNGGWPMTVWLTSEKKPFFGGTYFPARDGDRGSSFGFLTILKRLSNAYANDKQKVLASGEQIAKAIRANLKPQQGTDLPTSDILKSAAAYYKGKFDAQDGGMTGAPKFPSTTPIRFLLRYYHRVGERAFLTIATETLEKMAAGGIYDHVAGGFHRYSTDAQWLVPHFEKMLYDNALLMIAYLEAFQVSKNEEFSRVVNEIASFVDRDMTAPSGAFYSASDADSITDTGKREEGWFFTWTPAEIEQALTKQEVALISSYYGVSGSGNFEGRNILHVRRPLETVASTLKIDKATARSMLNQSREKLYQTRTKRPAPIRDEKILTAWNSLMISALARAGFVLNSPIYLTRAERAAQFLIDNLLKDGRLLRSYTDGEAKHNAYLDDYAFFIASLIDLYEVSGDERWLVKAISLDQVLHDQYEDLERGGFFMTSNDHEELLAREKPAYDGAEPSGNSVALLNLLRLHELTSDDRYRIRAESALRAFSGTLTSRPMALAEMLLAVDFFLDKAKEIVLVGIKGKEEQFNPFLNALRETFVPNRILAKVFVDGEKGSVAAMLPLLQGKRIMNGTATAFVCEKGICKFPTTDREAFQKLISKVEMLP